MEDQKGTDACSRDRVVAALTEAHRRKEACVDPASLVFELTETAAIGNIEYAKTFTTELRSRGVASRWTISAPASARSIT